MIYRHVIFIRSFDFFPYQMGSRHLLEIRNHVRKPSGFPKKSNESGMTSNIGCTWQIGNLNSARQRVVKMWSHSISMVSIHEAPEREWAGHTFDLIINVTSFHFSHFHSGQSIKCTPTEHRIRLRKSFEIILQIIHVAPIRNLKHVN